MEQGFNPPRPVYDPPFRPTKTSMGVILCRRNAKTGRPEALLAHKRYTYAFSEFVHGRYTRGRPAVAFHRVAPHFDYMTREELFDILSLNFEQMWYRIWLTLDNRDLYNKKYAKFQSTFMRDDGGVALRRLVMLARPFGTLLWEVPKGRRLSAREPDILCATRELYEETGVKKNEYRFLPGVKRRVSYVSAGTRYVCAYYVAIANPHLASAVNYDDPARPTLREINYMAEVSEVRWYDIEQIRLIDSSDSRIASLVAPAFKLMKQYLKGRWGFRIPSPMVQAFLSLPDPPLAALGAAAVSDAGADFAVFSDEHENETPAGTTKDASTGGTTKDASTGGTKDAPAGGTKDAPAGGTKAAPAGGTKAASTGATKAAPVGGTKAAPVGAPLSVVSLGTNTPGRSLATPRPLVAALGDGWQPAGKATKNNRRNLAPGLS